MVGDVYYLNSQARVGLGWDQNPSSAGSLVRLYQQILYRDVMINIWQTSSVGGYNNVKYISVIWSSATTTTSHHLTVWVLASGYKTYKII